MKNVHKIVHVFANYPHHVANMVKFFSGIDTHSECERIYIEYSANSDKEKYYEISSNNITFYNNFSKILKEIKKDKNSTVIFHSIFDCEQWVSLFFSGIYKRSIWVCWGGDLYKHILKPQSNELFKKKIKRNIELWIKRFLLRYFIKTIALNNGDAELIRKKLWVKSKGLKVLRYPMMDFNDQYFLKDNIVKEKPQENFTKIICGNSADPSNNHCEMLESLGNFKNENIKILMPLNYGGNKPYIDDVCAYGNRIFGDKFIPLTDFLGKKDYDALLGSADIGVFFHNRQQGLYVACSFLLQGKLMYIRGDVSSYQEFIGMGMYVGDSNKLSSISYEYFRHMPDHIAKKNSDIAERMFTEKYLAADWNRFFSNM